jgi:hypothetical protein
MATNLTTPSMTELSDSIVDSLVGGIADSRSQTPISGGKPILRLLKSGVWVYGVRDEPVQPGSEWAVNPLSICHGYVCWAGNNANVKIKLLGEKMVPISQRKPIMPEPVDGMPWKEQRTFELVCLNGEDEGEEVIYKTSSVGGMRGVDNFLAALIAQLKADKTRPVAVIQLDVDDYDHASYGQIFTPILTILGWETMNVDGGREAIAAAKPAAEPAAEPATARRAPARPARAPVDQAPSQEAAPPPPTRPGAAPRRQRPAVRDAI